MKHGVEKKNNLGYVRVTGSKKNDRLFFEISDNGAGAPKERIKQLNDVKGILETNSFVGGICNLYKRLSYFYKGDFKVVFCENPEGGLIARLDLPALREVNGRISHV
jgi:sensor histidine kinase YesM